MEDSALQEDPGGVLEFRLPDLGEGLADAELVSWSVGVGDRVELNQTIADVETAKAVVSLPSPFAGEVVELLAEPGDTVPAGAALIRVHTDRPLPATAPASTENSTEHSSVLLGYGPEAKYVSRRRRPVAAAGPIAPGRIAGRVRHWGPAGRRLLRHASWPANSASTSVCRGVRT